MASMSFLGHVWSDVEIENRGRNKETAPNLYPVVHKASKSDVRPPGQDGEIVWRNAIAFLILHMVGAYGFYLEIFGLIQRKTIIFMLFVIYCGAFGITVGVHRLWSHRCYKARLPMRILLAVFQTIAMQNDIYEWVRDHRAHHKFTDTDADPHNSNRGFFFSHMGWLMVRKHPDVISKGKTVDMKDLEADPVVMFQKKYYLWLVAATVVIPCLIPYWLWHENLWYSFVVIGPKRYVWSLHATWLVNSAAHIWGTHPYDKSISPTENTVVALLAFGEGWHNYHHAFPWDYKAAELGNYRLNFSTAFIDIFARLGLAYDLKTASNSMIEKRTQRTGVDSKDQRHGHGSVDKNLNKNGIHGYIVWVVIMIYYAYVFMVNN